MPTYIKPVTSVPEELSLQEKYKTLSSFVMSTDRRVTRLINAMEKDKQNYEFLSEKYNNLLEDVSAYNKEKNLKEILSYKLILLTFVAGGVFGFLISNFM